MEIIVRKDIDKKEIKRRFYDDIKDSLLNKDFINSGNINDEISKIIFDKFIINVFPIFLNLQEFDVSYIKKEKNQLIKIYTIEGNSLAEVLLTTDISDNFFIIKNVIISLKHI